MSRAPFSWLDRFDRWARIHPQERRLAYGAFCTQLLIGAAHAELETARDAMFLTRMTAAQLPFMYMAVAVLGVLMTELNRRSILRQRPVSLSAFLLAGALTTVAFTFTPPSTTKVYALYLWSALCAPWALLQFSLHLAGELSVEQAKRLLGFVGAGSVLGAVLGSGLARILLEFIQPQQLLWSAAMFLLLAAATTVQVGAAARTVQSRAQRKRVDYRTTRTEASGLLRDRYSRGLLVLLLSSTVAFTLIDYLFKSQAARSVPTAQLAIFLSSTQVITNAISLLVQLFAVAGLLRMVGAHAALLLLPTFLLGGAALFGIGANFAAALALRGADGSLRYSVHRTAIDILYFPLSDGARRRMKPVLEILGQRGGQALTAAALLAIGALGPRESVAQWIVLGLLVLMLLVWLFSVIALHRPYVELFKSSLALEQPSRLHTQELALPALEAAVAALNSQHSPEVIAALELLTRYRDGKLVPALILYHPDERVLVQALELLAANRRDDILPLTDRLLSHQSPDVRTAALRARLTLAPEESMARRFLEAPNQPEMAATALVGMVSHEWIDDEVACAHVARWTTEGKRFILPLAQAAKSSSSPPRLRHVLDRCLYAARTQQEQARVAEALALHPNRSSRTALIALLAHRVPREGARAALVALGEETLTELATQLAAADASPVLRRHLPETIRRFSPKAAARVLQQQLVHETDGMVRFKILRSLNRLRRDVPQLPLDEDSLTTFLQATLTQTEQLIRWYESLRAQFAPRGPDNTARVSLLSSSLELLLEVLLDKQALGCERVLRSINLLLPREDFRPLVVGLRSGRASRRASALEVLTPALPLRYREAVLSIVRYTFFPEARRALSSRAVDGGEVTLRAILASESGTLQALARRVAEEGHYAWADSIPPSQATLTLDALDPRGASR